MSEKAEAAAYDEKRRRIHHRNNSALYSVWEVQS
jgi:hypothetical protein